MLSKAEIGAKIRQLRLAKNKTQSDLGKVLEISYAAVSDIERGKTDLTVSDLYTIARFFDVPVNEFLQGQGQQPTISFSQNRYAKDITPAEKQEADKAIKSFDELVLKKYKK
jgi:transcriptional regulator with XRE-family HTH domain